MKRIRVRECPKCHYNNPVDDWFCFIDGNVLSVNTIVEKPQAEVEQENDLIKRNLHGEAKIRAKIKETVSDSATTTASITEKDLTDNINYHAEALSEALSLTEFWHNKTIEFADHKLRKEQKRIELLYSNLLEQETHFYEDEIRKLKSDLARLETHFVMALLGWEAHQWRMFSSMVGNDIPRLIRIGKFIFYRRFGQIQLTALIPIIGSRNVVIKASGSGKEKARSLIQSILLRLLGTIPPGKMRLICIDPIGLGSTVAGFIKGLPDFLTGGQAWFEQRTIEEKLTELERHMAFVKQKYLGVSFSTMEEFNEKAGKIEEPYRFLVISDFPSRFTDAAAQQLISIATNGPGTGVYTIVMVDTDQTKFPYGFILKDLERNATVITSKPEGNTCQGLDCIGGILEFDAPPTSVEFERIVNKVGEAAIIASEVKVPFIIPPESEIWLGDTRSGIRVPIGQYGAQETLYFCFDEKLLNSALVIGKTGSGKSTLLHVLINSLVLTYSPEEIELYLLDFKQVEFKDYALFGLPHAKVIAIKSEREFGISVLRGLDAELQRRKDVFGNITLLSEYRTKENQKLPRIILIADEFQELFTYDDSLAREAEMILDRLVRQGRAFGINIILSSQTLAGPNTFSSATRNQIPLRIAMQCSDSDSRLILSDDNDRAKYLERPGEAIYNATNGRLEGNNRFQVAWLDEELRKELIRKVRAMADRLTSYSYRKPIVFDGDANADVENNAELIKLINEDYWPKFPNRRSSRFAWVGEPIEIKPHTAIPFKKQSRSNLLVVGQNEFEETTVAMLTTAILSLASQDPPETLQFILVNSLDVDSPLFDIPGLLARNLPHKVIEVKRRGAVEKIRELEQEVLNRISDGEESKWSSIYIVFFGIHRVRDLRLEDGFYSESKGDLSPSELLSTIIREGPEVGVHALVWCDTYSNLERIFERRVISEFDLRVVLQMSPDDSRNLIDSDIANKLGPHRAIFYDEEKSGRLEKFRPYGLPNIEWLSIQTSMLNGRSRTTI